eukprot:99604_1
MVSNCSPENNLFRLCSESTELMQMAVCVVDGMNMNAQNKYKRGIKYLHKALKLMKIYNNHKMCDSICILIQTMCFYHLSLSYLALQKFRKASEYHNNITVNMLEPTYRNIYYQNALDLAFYLEEFYKINDIFAKIDKFNIASTCIWFYTAKLRYYMHHKNYISGVKWLHIANSKMHQFEANVHDKDAFTIWSICLIYRTQNKLLFDIENVPFRQLNGSAIYGLTYLVILLDQQDKSNKYKTEQFFIVQLIGDKSSFSGFNLGKFCYKNKLYLLAKKLIRKACKRSPQLPIIQNGGKQWKETTTNKWNTLCCSHCNIKYDCLKSCNGCGKVQYCSRKCQKKSWRDVHRYKCDKILTVSKSSIKWDVPQNM